MAKLRRPATPDDGREVSSEMPARENVTAYRRWRRIRADRLAREAAAKGDPRVGLAREASRNPWHR
jgi:hypothetical protein